MNDRTKRLWLPSITVILAGIALLAIFQIPLRPSDDQELWLYARKLVASPVFWRVFWWSAWRSVGKVWCILPFLGAAGAYWSRRAGSRRGIQVLAGMSPLLIFIAGFEANVRRNLTLGAVLPAGSIAPALAIYIVQWILIPGVSLLIGVLPFLFNSGRDRGIAEARHA